MKKSEALDLTLTANMKYTLIQNFSLKWASQSIHYLGIRLSADRRELCSLNFEPLIECMSRDLERWQKGFFSWLDLNNIIKMNVLPKFLYLLLAIPVKMPNSLIKKKKKEYVISRFIWEGKPARISKDILCRSNEKGGIGMPNIRAYVTSVHLSRIVDWNEAYKLLVQIEKYQAKSDFPYS